MADLVLEPVPVVPHRYIRLYKIIPSNLDIVTCWPDSRNDRAAKVLMSVWCLALPHFWRRQEASKTTTFKMLYVTVCVVRAESF